MTNPVILAYGGQKSQTGVAVKQEFPGVVIVGDKETFEEIALKLQTEPMLSVLPMWNSHRGEITESKVIELLFGEKSRLYQMWPKSITFECLKKSGCQITNIVSVYVAEDQCSQFIHDSKAKFISAESTTIAYERFKSEVGVDAVLRAPQENNDGFEVVSHHAENPLNFTTFVPLGGVGTQDWDESTWGSLYQYVRSAQSLYFGVRMPIRPSVLSEDQLELLESLMGEAKTIGEMPRVLFVSERDPGVCGLLIAADPGLVVEDILTDDGLSSEIKVIPNLGQTSTQYPSRASEVIRSLYPNYHSHDFVRHRGTKTCFYACPPLGLITHGYEEHVVEPVVREIISKCFEMYIKGALTGTLSQLAFFDKHKQNYLSDSKDFVEFTDIR